MFSTSLGSIELSSCIFNASGVRCSSFGSLKLLDKSKSGAIVSKSCTIEARQGNPTPNYYEGDDLAINSIGLANTGYDVYASYTGFNKPYIVSIAGTVDELVHMYDQIQKKEIAPDGVEFNLSCPNTCAEIIGYDISSIKTLLGRITKIKELPIGLKLPPYLNHALLWRIGELIDAYPVDYVVCSNTLPGILIDTKTNAPRIKPNNGIGGISGIKPVALANVRILSMITKTDIVGCGGIKSGSDVYEYLLCGASAVQIGVIMMVNGLKCFERIESELINIMKTKGQAKLSDIKISLRARL